MTSGPHKQYVRPGLASASSTGAGKGKENAVASVSVGGGESGTGGESEEKVEEAVGGGRKEVIIGGVAFEASKRSLVRKDCMFLELCFCGRVTHVLLVAAKPKPKTKKPASHPFTRKGPQGHLMARSRIYKPKGRNMTLDNTGRAYTHSQSVVFIFVDLRLCWASPLSLQRNSEERSLVTDELPLL